MLVNTPKAIAGIYAKDGNGIRFSSDESSLSITVLDTGEPLLVIPRPSDRGKMVKY